MACLLLHMEQPTATQVVAERVTARIKDRGTTVVWLCQDTGIPRATMMRRLAGHAPGFNLNELERIASSLDVTVASLVDPAAEVARP
jgi:DNA-binding Xre family transcriptional regulator